MGVETGISWCDHTWSPWRGCAKVSPGCKLCYAEAWSRRNPAVLGEWGPSGKRVINKDWRKPLQWDRAAAKAGVRRRVFPSLCDWLEDRDELVDERTAFLDLIAQTPNLDWLLLTKRPENFRTCLERSHSGMGQAWLNEGFVPPNVWYGVSAEDQEYADQRIPALLETPAAVRWVSYEPALGPIDFDQCMPIPTSDQCRYFDGVKSLPTGPPGAETWHKRKAFIDWIVVGGESDQGGERARAFNAEWARDTVAAGKAAGVPVFVKQLGALPFDRRSIIGVNGPSDMLVQLTIRDRKGGDIEEWPPELRVQNFPTASSKTGGATWE